MFGNVKCVEGYSAERFIREIIETSHVFYKDIHKFPRFISGKHKRMLLCFHALQWTIFLGVSWEFEGNLVCLLNIIDFYFDNRFSNNKMIQRVKGSFRSNQMT